MMSQKIVLIDEYDGHVLLVGQFILFSAMFQKIKINDRIMHCSFFMYSGINFLFDNNL